MFSEQIFGPVKNYTCQCGTYHGESKKGHVCPLCNVPIENSDERRRRFAKISLPIPVINPIMYEFITTCGSKLKPIIDVLMKKADSRVYYDEETDDFVLTTDDAVIPHGYKNWDKTEAIYMMIEHISKELSEDGYEEWKLIHDNIDKLIINNVIVLPPDLRPASPSMNNTDVDKINRNYMQILVKKEQIENDPLLIVAKKEFKYIPDRTIFLDQNGQILEKSLLSNAFNSVLSKIKKDASLGDNLFYRVRCKEKSRTISIDIKGDFTESDFGVKIEFIEGFERQAVTQNATSDQKLFNQMHTILSRHIRSEIPPNDGTNS